MAKTKKPFSYKPYMFAAAHKIWRWYPVRHARLKLAKITPNIFKCEICSVLTDKVQVDHITPVVDPKTGFTTWDDYFERMFCSVENLQVLCHECHKQKTQAENSVRRKKKKGTVK